VKKISGWTLVALGAFIIISGTSHEWYEKGPVHTGWNKVVQIFAGDQIAEKGEDAGVEDSASEDHEDGSDYIPGTILPSVVLLILVALPIVWYKAKFTGKDEQQSN